jgi:alkylation response protein AidB-like acyl-CoA dehydrogenase
VLGEVGKGHKVAFNVLNFARFKLGAMCGGGAQAAIGEAAKYAAERRQFGQPIASFGAIKHKIGEMVVRTYAIESLLYRTAGMVDRRIAATIGDGAPRTDHGADSDGSAALAAFEEYAIEASIAKVAGSEMLNFVLDENIQIHGGNGYVRDYPAERHFRDARVNRIFEGTNEINRLLIPGMLARRAVKNELPVIAAAKALQEELLGPPAPPSMDDGILADERRSVESFKKSALMVFGVALQTYGQKLSDQQEVLMHVADMLIDVFAAESAVLRAIDASNGPAARAALHVDAARVFVSDAAMRVEASAKQALAAMADGDTLRTMQSALRRLSKTMPINTAALRRRLADEAVARGGYPFTV